MSSAAGSQVRSGLSAGGKRIRTLGPPLRQVCPQDRPNGPSAPSARAETHGRDRGFESRSLQRGVRCEPGTATTFSFLVGAGLLPYVVEDLVAGLARNAERATDLAHRFAVQQPSDEPQALVHHRTLLPRHPRLPRKGERCYPCVRYDLSPMT